jgi:hypothetical protein
LIKRYRNALFEAVVQAGLSSDDFSGKLTASDNRALFDIQYRDTSLHFFVRGAPHNPDSFEYSFTRFAPGYAKPPQTDFLPKDAWVPFPRVLEEFRTWLTRDGQAAVEEEILPDLWARASSGIVSRDAFAGHNTSDFSPEERRQVKLAVETFKHLLISAFKPTQQQLGLVEAQLSYLSNAVDRLNRFDWRGAAISTLLSISIALTLSTDQGRQLYGLFQQAFSALTYALR